MAGGSVEFLGRPIRGQGAWDLVKQGLVMVPEGRGVFSRMTIVVDTDELGSRRIEAHLRFLASDALHGRERAWRLASSVINALLIVTGIIVDAQELRRLSADFDRRLVELAIEIHRLAGHEFNIGSPKQLGEVMFDEMKLGTGSKSAKTGAYATGADVLQEPIDQPYGVRDCAFRDPAGNMIRIQQLA